MIDEADVFVDEFVLVDLVDWVSSFDFAIVVDNLVSGYLDSYRFY
jgi:hypothetical protein